MNWHTIPQPLDSDFPETTCSICGKSKINGLYTPLELRTDRRCRVCIGELNFGHKRNKSVTREAIRSQQ